MNELSFKITGCGWTSYAHRVTIKHRSLWRASRRFPYLGFRVFQGYL
jgi:hypothetical protein